MFTLTKLQTKQLDLEGYVLLPGVLPKDQVERLLAKIEELWAEEGERAGDENYIEPNARRLANLINKGEIFRSLLVHPLILEATKAVLGDEVRLSMFNARDALPYSDPKMPYHCDTDHGAKPDKKGYLAYTAIWMLD